MEALSVTFLPCRAHDRFAALHPGQKNAHACRPPPVAAHRRNDSFWRWRWKSPPSQSCPRTGSLGFSRFGVTAEMAGFFLVTIVLTRPMSNAAAALVVVPLA